MSDERKSPAERLLDLLVFGPAGLAVTAAEEFPRLVEKGRHRVEGQLHAARLIGQVAVQMGRHQVEKTVGSVVPKPSPNRQSGSSRPASPSSTGPDPTPASAPVARPTETVAHAAPSPAAGFTTADSPNGTMASSVLGIPGYDSLSASQVVQRLGGLSSVELEAVRGHESTHRHRRTILNRVDQLLGGEDGDG